MATSLTQILKASFLNNYGMLERAIDACPDSAWAQANGGLPFWQQAGHAFSSIDFLLRGKDDPAFDIGMNPGLFDFGNKQAQAPSKAELKGMTQRMTARGAELLDKLTDEELVVPHAGFKDRLGREMPTLVVVNLVIGHAMYHLGICDSVLRDNGKPGIL